MNKVSAIPVSDGGLLAGGRHAETDEILKQSLVIEPDLQHFIDFVLRSVEALGGNTFAASVALLGILEQLRAAGVAKGHPMTISLLLRHNLLSAKWGATGQAAIASLNVTPDPGRVAELRAFLENSLALVDPEILLQRNAEMMRHFDEVRARTERELEAMQRTLKQRQQELLETSRQAESDALTGLFNRRAYDEKLRQAFLHTMRQRSSPLSLMLFDLDYFKDINDQYGHQAGDEYLRKMANVLRGIIRENVDMAFRFGGDEFAVVLFADYRLACDKARQVLAQMDNRVSAGIASVNQDTEGDLALDEFIRRADEALYEAKNQGRGRAVVDRCTASVNDECRFVCGETNA